MSEAIHEVPDIADPVEIGRGGYGAVFRATDLQVDRQVAVKLLSVGSSDGLIAQFERERASLGRVSTHPNVVTLHRTGVTPSGVPFLVMEFAPGGSLVDRLRGGGPFAWEDAVDWMVPVCDAVEHAHSQGVRHRDIKPQNILVSAHGQPLLSDFGIAALTLDSDTATHTAKLSLSYASPEQIDGRPLDDSTDVYSLGATLYTLIAGAPPFADVDGVGLLKTAQRIMTEDAPALDPVVPVEIREAIEAAMGKEPTRRPSVAGLRDALLGEVTVVPVAAVASLDELSAVTTEMPPSGVPFEPSGLTASVTGDRTVALASGRTGRGAVAALLDRIPLRPVALAVAGLVVASVLAAAAWTSISDDGDSGDNALDSASSGAVDTNDGGDGTDTTSGLDDGAEGATPGSSSSPAAALDSDGDGIADPDDVCVGVADPDQVDLDGDGQGDACDADDDGDAVVDDADNCPLLANPDQGDEDADGVGDTCDDFTDVDNDGVADSDDPCVVQPDEPDADADGIPDRCDTTPRGVVTVAASVRIDAVTILNQAYDGEADMFGDLTVAGEKTGLPEISDQREIRPANWSSGLVDLESDTDLIRVRIWIRDEDACFLCRDGLVDVTPEQGANALHLVIDPATGTVDRASQSWNRIETIATLTGPTDGDLSGTITQEGDDDAVHRATMDVSLTLVREPAS